jgi:hypothetical protein
MVIVTILIMIMSGSASLPSSISTRSKVSLQLRSKRRNFLFAGCLARFFFFARFLAIMTGNASRVLTSRWR